LIPIIDNPSRVGDFRPISLLNNSIKLLTKQLANRLEKVILEVSIKISMGLSRGGVFKIALLGLLNIFIFVTSLKRN
jgi:hypothetical protein